MCEMLQRAPASTQNLVFQSDAHPALLLLNVSEVTAFLPFKLLHPQSGGLVLHPLAKQLFGGGGEFRGGVDHPLSWRGEKKSLVLSEGCPSAGNRADSLPPFMPVCASREHNHDGSVGSVGLWGLAYDTTKSMSALAALYLPFFFLPWREDFSDPPALLLWQVGRGKRSLGV